MTEIFEVMTLICVGALTVVVVALTTFLVVALYKLAKEQL